MCLIVGNRQFLEESESYWKALIDYCNRRNLVQEGGREEEDAKEGIEGLVENVKILGLGLGNGVTCYDTDHIHTWKFTL